MEATRPIPGPFGFCFSGSEQAFCGALETAVINAAARPNDSERGAPKQFSYVEIGLGQGDTLASAAQYLESLIGVVPNFTSFLCTGVDLPEYNGPAKSRVSQRGVSPNRVQLRLVGANDFFKFFPLYTAGQKQADFIFIDGCHGCACAMDDFLGAERIISPGGVVVLHDTSPNCQGLHPQPHCGTGIDVRRAVTELGLLNETRPGWTYLGETFGDTPRGGHGCLFVQKAETLKGLTC